MVYRRDHWPKSSNCDAIECKPLTAYVRIDGKWKKIGHWGSECHKFELIDEKQEEKDRLVKQKQEETDRLIKQKLAEIKSEVSDVKVSFTGTEL